jgi:hypothetical protein
MVEPRGSMAKLAQRAEGALRPTFCPTFCPTHCPTHLPAPFQPLGSALGKSRSPPFNQGLRPGLVPHLAPQPLEQRRRHHNLVGDQSHQLLRSVPLLRENPQDRQQVVSSPRVVRARANRPARLRDQLQVRSTGARRCPGGATGTRCAGDRPRGPDPAAARDRRSVSAPAAPPNQPKAPARPRLRRAAADPGGESGTAPSAGRPCARQQRRTRSASCGKLNGTVAMARLRVAPPRGLSTMGPRSQLPGGEPGVYGASGG